MTEQEWLSGTDAERMCAFLAGKATDRKLRLFVLARCHQNWHRIDDGVSRHALALGEQFIEGKITASELLQVRTDLKMAARSGWWADLALRICSDYTWSSVPYVGGLWQEDEEVEVESLRCIFGNPYRPLTINPSLLNDSVLRLAAAIYEERAFERMPVLADALEESGVTDSALLGHLRGPGPHARGCHVLDLVLGKD